MRHRRHIPIRPALSIIEAVFAVAMLALVAASLFSTIDFLLTRQVAQDRKLAAMEIANRVMLQYLDDPRELDASKGLPIRYHPSTNADLFRWELEETDVDIELDPAVASLGENAQSFDTRAIYHVTVRVWLSEHSGGAYRPAQSPIVLELKRIVDPLGMRTPQQVGNIFNDFGRIQEIFGK
jgi:hypothetical protein